MTNELFPFESNPRLPRRSSAIPMPQADGLARALHALLDPTRAINPLASIPKLADRLPPILPAPRPSIEGLPQVKRRTFFSFHYDDVMRVNNVRNGWSGVGPNKAFQRTFYDSSLWERRKAEGDIAIKALIRAGVRSTSVVCVLIGTDTWKRRWVRYEIARSVLDQRGLLAVHVNGLNHHRTGAPDHLGPNPLDFLGVRRLGLKAYKLVELRARLLSSITGDVEWRWTEYKDLANWVRLPRWMPEPPVGGVLPLSSGSPAYDYAADVGPLLIGNWIDQAALFAGR